MKILCLYRKVKRKFLKLKNENRGNSRRQFLKNDTKCIIEKFNVLYFLGVCKRISFLRNEKLNLVDNFLKISLEEN